MQRMAAALFLVLLLASSPASASQEPALDWSFVYRGVGPVEDGHLANDLLILHFRADALPDVRVGKDGGVETGQLALDALNRQKGVQRFERLFSELPAAKAANEPIERKQLYILSFQNNGESLKSVADRYLALPSVTRVEPVAFHHYAAEVPNDPLFQSAQDWLRQPSPGLKDIRGIAAWYHQKGDPNVLICIADSGVDWQHPDLGGTAPDYLDGVIWDNVAERTGTPGVDDDGNGKVDDIRGWDFLDLIPGNFPAAEQTPPQDVAGEDNDPMDYDGHGTSVAGCSGAATDNGIGVAGASWGCTILPAKIGYLPNNSNQGIIGTHWAARAMDYARLSGAKVFNGSWGSSNSGGLGTATDLAVAAGMVVVTAAGNDDDEVASYLGARTDVLAVAAVTSSDGKASFSSYGDWVELSAPGVAIQTTGFNRNGAGSGMHVYSAPSGTSFSSPIVAGVAGLYFSANPGASGAQARAALMAAVDDVYDDNLPIYDGKLGTGRSNMAKFFENPMWLVPDQLPTLLDGINTAEDGDTVAVAASTVFTGKVTLPRRPMSILGGWDANYQTRDPINNKTLISVSGTDVAVTGTNTSDNATIFDGFEITGGAGPELAGVPVTARYGGGILLRNGASPTISNVFVHGNIAGTSSDLGAGGGIAVIGGSPVFTDVEVSGNSARNGAGIYVYDASVTFNNLDVHDNTSYNPGFATPQGGGLYIIGPAVTTEVTIDGGNVSGHVVNGPGGGIYVEDASIEMNDVTVVNNEATDGYGGGAYVLNSTYIGTENVYDDNGAAAGGVARGGGIYAEGSSISITGSDFTTNSSDFGGGGIALNNCTSPFISQTLSAGNTTTFLGTGVYVENCTDLNFNGSTVVGNTGAAPGSNGLYISSGTHTVSNSIFSDNGGGGSSLADGVACSGATITFSCNLVWNNTGGNYSGCPDPTGSNGNVNLDPLYCNAGEADYRVGPSSPAAAAQSGCGDMGSEGVGCGGTPVEPGAPNFQLALQQNVPNPFNPTTEIHFTLPAAGRARVRIFDLRGRLVRVLLDESMPAGDHSVQWNGRTDDGATVASGTYFYELRSGDHRAVRKMGLIK